MAARRLLLVHLFLPETLSFQPWPEEPSASHYRVPSQARGNGDVGPGIKGDAPPSPHPEESQDFSNLSYEDLNVRLKRASLTHARRVADDGNENDEAISDTEVDPPEDSAEQPKNRKASRSQNDRGSFSEHVKKASMTSLMSEMTAARSQGGQSSLPASLSTAGSRRGSATLNRPILQEPVDLDMPLAPASDHGRSATGTNINASPIQMTPLEVKDPSSKHSTSRRGSMSRSGLSALSAPTTLQVEKHGAEVGGTRTPGAHAGGKAGMMTPLSIIGDLKAKRAAVPAQQLSTPGDTVRHHPFGTGAVTPMRDHGLPTPGTRTPGLRPPISSGPFSRNTVSGLALTKVNENPSSERNQKPESKTPNKASSNRPGLGNPSRTTEGRIPQTPIDHGRGADLGAAPAKASRPALTPRPSSSNVISRLFRESDNESHTPFAEPSPAKLPSGEPASASAAGQIVSGVRNRSGSKPRSNARQGTLGRRASSISGRPGNRRASTDVLEEGSSHESRPQSPVLPPYDFIANPSCNGGLVNAVRSLDEESLRGGKLFIGTPSLSIDEWAGDREREHIEARMRNERDCLPVWLDDYTFEGAYAHFCKQILWPTFHYELPTRKGLEHEHEGFECYRQLNEKFAEVIVNEYREGDIIFVNDYHLVLVPAMVRDRLPHAKICFFLHIAWPSSEIFRCLTARTFILKGMLGADLVGFQTANFARHFRQTVSRILQLEATPKGIQIDGRGGFVTVGVFPIGIDVAVLNKRRAQPDVADWVQKLQARYEGKKIIVGRDKLDSIKGVRQKLLAFETLLHEHAELIGEIVLLQVALATTEENEEIAAATDVVARINNRYSTLTYQPVVFLHVQDITFCQYLALLTVADAFLATSLREGMNLTTHEFVVCQEMRHKPLILSEFTGTYSSLRACIGINPWNTKQVADAIYRAIRMDAKEEHERWKDLHRQVTTQDAQHWIKSLLGRLERAHIDQQRRNNLFVPRLEIGQSEWRASKSRLIFFDLEGTLMRDDPVAFYEKGFEPPKEVVDLLLNLTDDAKNRVYVMSGKGARDLDKLAAKVPRIGLVAENGCSVMYAGASSVDMHSSDDSTQNDDGKVHKAWTSLVAGTNMSWRDSVLEILSYFTERTPGSWLEDRGASILWRFWSKADDVEAGQDKDYQWARRQAAEVQNLIYDSLGERFSLRIIPAKSSFLILPKNTSRASAAQHILSFSHVGAQYGLHPAASNSERQGPVFSLNVHGGSAFDTPATPPTATSTTLAPSPIEHPMDSFRQPSNAWAPSTRSPEQPFGPNAGHRRRARYNAYALHPNGLGAFDLVLCVGQDDGVFSYINALDLAFAPITCTSAGSGADAGVGNVGIGSEANYYLDGPEDVLSSVRDILDFRGRDQRWGVPAMVDV